MATEATGSAESAAGMPQLEFSTFPNQIFWLVITLVVIYFILSRIALPRIGAILAERRGTITNDLAAAEELKLQAAEAEKAYEKALADARAEASRIVEKSRAEIQADLDAAMERANAEIAEKSAESEKRIAEIRESAVQSVSEVARDTTSEILAKFDATADVKTVNAAVDARLKEGGMA